MMHSIARYYNTSERMTALFVKITNQMITCCKNYINADGDIWEQNRLTLIEKFAACQRLNDAYQVCGVRVRAKVELDVLAKVELDVIACAGQGGAGRDCLCVVKLTPVMG